MQKSITIVAAAAAGLVLISAAAIGHGAMVRTSFQIAPIDPTCTSSSPCIQYDNNGTGQGVKGLSALGNGLGGITKANSTNSSNGRSGVFGIDNSSSGTFDSGVSGHSTRGNGVSGTSVHGNGVSGISSSSTGVYAQSSSANGVFAISSDNDGINVSTLHNSSNAGFGRSAIYAHDDSTDQGHLNLGVGGFSIGSIGVEGGSQTWIGANVIGGALYTTFEVPAFSIVENANGATVLMDACSSGVSYCGSGFSEQVMELESSGDMFLKGEIHTSGSCVVGCIPTANHKEARIVSYAPSVTQPTREDYGEAHLINGQSYVRLDPVFANVIDHSAGYLVFLTPEGPSQGLYVTGKSIAGFSVRENPGGHASIDFQYRIVARPYGNHERRLPTKYYQTTPQARRSSR